MSEIAGGLPPIIGITGPTAVGKSALALDLAPRYSAEIVSADSRQVYRHLDIGTAKPTAAEQARVVHHLIDVVDPDEPYSAAAFRADADRALLDIMRRGRVAFLVGGSPHYLQAVLDRLEIPPVAPQLALREELEAVARDRGPEALHAQLREVDPEAAEQIDPFNVRRVVRALEVIRVTGELFSVVGRRRGEPIPALRLAVTTDRETLYRRIDARVEQQIEDGLIDEARRVLDLGFDPGLPPLAGLVYREAIAVATGKMTLEAAAQRMKETTHAFARRQYTWFRKDHTLEWLELGPELGPNAEELIRRYLEHPRPTGAGPG
jgi:tRNA dimethylallyltransferase